MEDLREKILNFAQQHKTSYQMILFSLTWTIILYTYHIGIYLHRFNILGMVGVILLMLASVFLYSAFKRCLTKKETEIAFKITKSTLFFGALFCFILPICYIVTTEFGPYAGVILAFIAYVIFWHCRHKIENNSTIAANLDNLKKFDFFKDVVVSSMTVEQKQELEEAKKKARAQMKTDKNARRFLSDADIVEIPSIENPELDTTPQFKAQKQ